MIGKLEPEFEAFVGEASTSLFRFACLLAGDPNHAEDLLQVAFLRTARRWKRARRQPHAFVRRVLVNLAHDRRRSLGRRPRETPWDLAQPDVTEDPMQGLVDRDALVREVLQLPVRQRAVLLLRYWEDLSIEETARTLGCSTGTVKSHTHRALTRLRGTLSPAVRGALPPDVHSFIAQPVPETSTEKGFTC